MRPVGPRDDVRRGLSASKIQPVCDRLVTTSQTVSVQIQSSRYRMSLTPPESTLAAELCGKKRMRARLAAKARQRNISATSREIFTLEKMITANKSPDGSMLPKPSTDLML